jgi:hypothetical protein
MSELPVPTRSQWKSITDQLSDDKFKNYKIVAKFNGSDNDASTFGSDLYTALKAAGWKADFSAGFGGTGIRLPVPIAIGVKAPSSQADSVQNTLQGVLGIQIPKFIDASIPADEVDVFVVSRSTKVPQ